jgi:DTW domain-containing protein YfiP
MTQLSSPEVCARCERPADLCVCAAIEPVAVEHRVLILRHPREQDRVLGSARLAELQIAGAVLKTGLSWRNLEKALGKTVDPKRWGVLYLGAKGETTTRRPLSVLTKKGGIAEDQDQILASLDGIVLLDGNWSQAKTLWWRNAWMIKCRRLVLQPPRPSLYGNLRKEPRRESVSTIEAAAYALAALEGDEALADKILAPFALLIQKARARGGRL